jgi:hypothetical protein
MTVTINKQEFKIPNSWSKVTTQQLMNYLTGVNAEMTNRQYQAHLIHSLTGIPKDAVMEQHGNWVANILKELSFTESNNTDAVIEFKFGDKKFNPVPAGQLCLYEVDVYEQLEVNLNANLNKVMALICRTEGDQWVDGKFNFDYDTRCQDFLQLPANITLGVSNFFFLKSILTENNSKTLALRNLVNLRNLLIEEFQTVIRKSRISIATQSSWTLSRWSKNWILKKLIKFWRYVMRRTYITHKSSTTTGDGYSTNATLRKQSRNRNQT